MQHKNGKNQTCPICELVGVNTKKKFHLMQHVKRQHPDLVGKHEEVKEKKNP